jgi:hypothetical protein
MKKTAFLTITLLLLNVMSLTAQEYQTGLGVRGGLFSGISVKHFTSGSNAIEGVIATHYRGLLLAGMYQMHAPAFDAPGLYWYYGGGAHIGIYNRRHRFDERVNGNVSTFGVLGVVGLEYKINEIPITIGIDITPGFDIIGNTDFWISSGIAVRYTFGR